MGQAARLITGSVNIVRKVANLVRMRALDIRRGGAELRNITHQGLQISPAWEALGPAAATQFPWRSVSVI